MYLKQIFLQTYHPNPVRFLGQGKGSSSRILKTYKMWTVESEDEVWLHFLLIIVLFELQTKPIGGLLLLLRLGTLIRSKSHPAEGPHDPFRRLASLISQVQVQVTYSLGVFQSF